MKPCSRNRKSLALLAANALDAPAANKLREHTNVCPACREYFSEISGLASVLSQPQKASEIEASERFHQKLAGRIRATETQSLAAYLAGVLFKPRIFIPVAGVFVLVGIIASRLHGPPPTHSSPNDGGPAIATAKVTEDISPTFANYQNAANQSLDQLDSLLTRQAREGLPPTPVYTASATALAQGPL